MSKLKKTFLVLRALWIVFFIYLAYRGYDVNGEASMVYALLFIMLTFPAGLIAIPIMRFLDSYWHLSQHGGGIVMAILLFVLGYVQWFLLVPWIFARVVNTKKPEKIA